MNIGLRRFLHNHGNIREYGSIMDMFTYYGHSLNY